MYVLICYLSNMKDYLKLVKFSHTIFALPFAMVGFFLAVLDQGRIEAFSLVLVLLCMVFARNAAMSFNRWADRSIDAKNPRTAKREIPSGALSADKVLLFAVLNSILFIVTSWFINQLCFFLSPVALLVILGYSYAKRFTFLAHFILGVGLALAPIGAYLSVTGHFSIIPILYGIVVLTWVAGFDIIYALQDESVDVDLGLHSVPSRFGAKGALKFSLFVHFICVSCLLFAAYLCAIKYEEMRYLFGLGTVLFLILIFYQHRLVKHDDLSKIDMAFFKTNGIASLCFGLCFIIDATLI